MPDIQVTIGGFAIPMTNVYELVENTDPMEKTNVTLDGTRYTDFRSPGNLRSWTVKFAFLCVDDYNSLRTVYLDQYSNATYPSFVVPFYSINTVAKLTVSDKNIKFDGDMIVGYEIQLEEEYAIS